MMEHDDGTDSIDLPAPIADLSALYPRREDAEWDALVAGIMTQVGPELARRRPRDRERTSERGFVRSLLRWSRPVAAAAAAVLLVGGLGLALTSDAESQAATTSFAEVVDREPASTLLAADRPPSASDLESALENDSFKQEQP
jgi:anti-sigma factor RsiW